MKLKKLTLNLTLMAVSTAVALFLCELAARLVLDPVDYLSPTLVRDDTLGIRLPPGSSGHDDWGFRNERVPESVDIVALGDSHTYGNCARMAEAWPAQVARISGRSVYNLGMGGYGPNQYLHLLRTKAFTLKPKIVVCGLYFGDDFDNAFRITYGLEPWAPYRQSGLDGAEADIWEQDQPHPNFQKRVRNWLSSHSILYRLVVHGLLQNTKAAAQMRASEDHNPKAVRLRVPEQGIEEAFLPRGVRYGLDPASPTVCEGMRLTFQFLSEMNALCASNQVRFVVAVIPTKETVFARHLADNAGLPHREHLETIIDGEQAAREQLFAFLKGQGIPVIDTLGTLVEASKSAKLYTPGTSDMHPGAMGYRVIAGVIASNLPPVAGP